jgi:AcrR family transcriptional regulator
MSTMSDTARDDRRKAPRRTAERILAAALDLFNRRGEPNVSTTLISAELNISPGNLYYHYPAKEELVNALMSRYEAALNLLLDDESRSNQPAACATGGSDIDVGSDPVGDTLADPLVDPASTQAPPQTTPDVQGWLLLPALLTLAWRYRFLFRDMNDLLARNRQLETRCQITLERQIAAVHARVIEHCRQDGAPLSQDIARHLSTSIVVLLTYWLSYEYVRDPRHALEPDGEADVLASGNRHVMALLAPYLARTPTAQDEPLRASITP